MGSDQGDARRRSVDLPTDERGYAMAALLVGLSVMAVLMTMALPVWSHAARREKEAELIWRGEQYARAVALWQRRYANTFPPSLDVLVEQRFLRKKYKDPITNEDFQPIPAGGATPVGGVPPGGRPPQGPSPPGQPPQQAPFGPTQSAGPAKPGGPQGPGGTVIGIQGVVSKSKDTAIRIYNGRTKYNEWAFVALATAQGVSGPQQPPGQRGPQPPGQRDPRAPFGGVQPPPGGTGTRPPVPGQPPFGPPQFPPGGEAGQPAPGQPGQPSRPFGPPGQPPQRPPGR